MNGQCKLTDVQTSNWGKAKFTKPQCTVICGVIVRICPVHKTLERLINDKWVKDEAA